MVAGFVVLLIGATSILVIIAGVLTMDFGAGLSHAANQSSAFALRPEARGRVNSVYMSGDFVGGAIGTSIATLAYGAGGWPLVCLSGAACPGISLILEIVTPVQARHRVAAGVSSSMGDAALARDMIGTVPSHPAGAEFE